MNFAVRGDFANLGEVPADTFFKDQHSDLKADYIMANPPLNLKNWRGLDKVASSSQADFLGNFPAIRRNTGEVSTSEPKLYRI